MARTVRNEGGITSGKAEVSPVDRSAERGIRAPPPPFLTPQVADSTHSIFVGFACPKSDDFGRVSAVPNTQNVEGERVRSAVIFHNRTSGRLQDFASPRSAFERSVYRELAICA
jgi:hypothetical protein